MMEDQLNHQSNSDLVQEIREIMERLGIKTFTPLIRDTQKSIGDTFYTG